MSSRQLRKLRKQKELQEIQEPHADKLTDDGKSTDDNRPPQKPRASLFSGFAALAVQDEQDDNVDEEEDEPVDATVKPDQADATMSSSKKSKKKKKKKKAKKQQIAQNDGSDKEMDEIDQALRELEASNLSKDPDKIIHNGHDFVKPYERVCELLSINMQHLKVINEMRNLFGREAITVAQMEREQEDSQARRQGGEPTDLETYLRAHPGLGLSELTIRRNPFITGKESWPAHPTDGLTMEQVQEQAGTLACLPGTVEFKFVHNISYNLLEMAFFRLVQGHDPLRIVHFLASNPYHISSLIQVSTIAKEEQNSALSTELCERALFTFGRVSLSAFRQKLEQGKARLSFLRPENRQFWLAGYHYLKNLIMKGTYRTALEWAKLLLSICHADPYGIIHFIHPLAIRAHESKWFIDLCDSDLLDMNEAVQYSQAYIRQTLVLAKLQQNDRDGARALLWDGMCDLPWLYSDLFEALGLDRRPACYGWLPPSEADQLHASLYIHQTKSLWGNTQAKSLLLEIGGEWPVTAPTNMKTIVSRSIITVNFARFVYLLGIPSMIGLLPRELLDMPVNWEFDPFPPPMHQNIFSYPSQMQPWEPSHSLGNIPGNSGRLPGIDAWNEMLREEVPQHIVQELEDAMRNMAEGQDMPATNNRLVHHILESLRNEMPGAWPDDNSEEEEITDDELPHLLPAGELNSANDADTEAPPPGGGNDRNDLDDGAEDDGAGFD
ncbi:DUF654-domain-containing protein [Hypoxylon sp. NC1633]|nr:DUF654-domain-containing protein [Hypoxylon sp. NC1633]